MVFGAIIDQVKVKYCLRRLATFEKVEYEYKTGRVQWIAVALFYDLDLLVQLDVKHNDLMAVSEQVNQAVVFGLSNSNLQ